MQEHASIERLRQTGLRLTPQRTVIFEILGKVKGHGHLTAQQVFDVARDRLPGLNVATVYRSLEALHEAGLVDRMLAQPGDEVRYAVRDPQHRHCHLVCSRCGREHELELDVVLRLARAVEKETGFRVDVDHLTLGGRCQTCTSG
jgi:Fur family ferric uptake transcriptional regulator